MSIGTADFLLEIKPSTTWVPIADADVKKVDGKWAISGNRENALSFGNDTDATMSAQFTNNVRASLTHLLPIRYTTTMDADTQKTFVGVVTKQHWTLTDCDIGADGLKVLIAATKIYSPMIQRRPIATKTAALVSDDPTNPAYKGGMINYALWTAGGRPFEQAATYPSATFYYSCDHAILSPDYTWFAGEDTWQECLKAAQAGGGTMYQDADGVVRYKQVQGYAGGTATDSIGNSDYEDADLTTDPGVQQGNKWTCQYTPRRRLGTQQIADDTTVRHVEPGETITIVIEPQNPIVALETKVGDPTQLRPEALVVAQQDGQRVAQGGSGYTHTLDVKAARVTITVTNASSKAFLVWRVVLRGDPVVATEAGSVSSGSGLIERQIEPSVYIQRRSDAERLCEMYAVFSGTARPTVNVKRVKHKPSRAIGQTILFSCQPWSMVDVPHVILEISHNDTGTEADYILSYVGDLPNPADFYIVGNSYSGSDNKYLGW